MSVSEPRPTTPQVSPADGKPLFWCGAAELARRIARGETTAAAVVEAHIQRIEEVNPRLNAVVVPLFDRARREAQAADERQMRGEPLGPLHGVPMTVKECFHVPGTKATIGVDRLADVAEEESVLVARLRAAGAIVLGKTNIPQLMVLHETDNPIYGRTNNPWDLTRGPGGSSGGEASIIAAGGSPLGLGNDLGGSIRQPAHSCGICGLKPTSWRLPEVGTRTNWNGMETVITQAGPLARTVEDLALAMQIMASPGLEQVDPRIPPVAWREPAEVRVESLRVGYWEDSDLFPASPAVRRAVREAAAALAERGVNVEPFTPPDVQVALDLYFGLISADGGGDARRLLGRSRTDWRVRRLLLLGGLPAVVRRATAGVLGLFAQRRAARLLRAIGGISTDAYWQLTYRRAQYLERFQRVMQRQRIDVLLCPPHALPALPHGASEHPPTAAGDCMLFNFLGMPAGVVPFTRVRSDEEHERVASYDLADRAAAAADQGSAGLPVGVQVAAAWWREDHALAVMAALEQFRVARDHGELRPGL